jgi:hypothetical protein
VGVEDVLIPSAPGEDERHRGEQEKSRAATGPARRVPRHQQA